MKRDEQFARPDDHGTSGFKTRNTLWQFHIANTTTQTTTQTPQQTPERQGPTCVSGSPIRQLYSSTCTPAHTQKMRNNRSEKAAIKQRETERREQISSKQKDKEQNNKKDSGLRSYSHDTTMQLALQFTCDRESQDHCDAYCVAAEFSDLAHAQRTQHLSFAPLGC